MKKFIELKAILNHIEDLRLTQPMVFLGPFLDVIRSEETTGPITSLALAGVNKFLSYGLIGQLARQNETKNFNQNFPHTDPTHPNLSITVDKIADAVTHARFVGTDQASDGIVLLRIVYLLRTLMLNPEGSALTNESVCEIMLSCFRICFEPRLNELLRKNAEQTLKEIVQLLFMRLPQFSEERSGGSLKKMIASGALVQESKKRKAKPKLSTGSLKAIERKNSIKSEANDKNGDEPITPKPNQLVASLKPPVLATTPATPGLNIVDMQGSILQTPTSSLQCEMVSPVVTDTVVADERPNVEENAVINEIKPIQHQDSVDNDADIEDCVENSKEDDGVTVETKGEDFINSMGVRFTPQSENGKWNFVYVNTLRYEFHSTDGPSTLTPYGLPCIRELLRFLISLCNPSDKQNTDAMIHMGLSLLTVALEVGADSIGNYDTLLNLVKDDMCKNLFAVSLIRLNWNENFVFQARRVSFQLLNSERLTIFAADLQVCFLLFESQRSNLKFHLEYYLSKLAEIIASENPRTPYEMRELALDNLLQCWRIPGFATELYINYDCNLYCTNLLEDLIKLLSKNALSATQNIYSIHRLSLDGLLTIIESIEQNCVAAKVGKAIDGGRHSRNNSSTEKIVIDIPSGGDESSGVDVENINNIINTSTHLKSKNAQFIFWTPEQLIDIKNKKRVRQNVTWRRINSLKS